MSLYSVYCCHQFEYLVMCIRDRRKTILSLSTVCIAGVVYSGQVQYHFVSLFSVYCCLQYISRCRTGYVYSGQVQYHSVF